jgi:cysteine-rich repeat protein
MTHLGLTPRRWLARHTAALGALALSAVLASGAGCAQQISTNTGGTGGATTATTMATTTTSTTTTSTTSTTSTTTSTTTTSTTTTSTTTTTTSSGGGMGGAGSTTGTGGTGGVFVPPTGTADYPAEVEPNNIESQANLLAPGTKGFTASIWPLGDVDDFKFVVAAGGGSASVTISDGMGGCPSGFDALVRILDAMGNDLADNTGSFGCPSFTPQNNMVLATLPAGAYYVHIEDPNLQIIPFYVVDIHVTEPSCGDGIVQVGAGEQCDDGALNGQNGNACSATCQLTSGNYLNETEPNDTRMTANDLDGYAGAVAQISPAGDTDYFQVSVTVPGSSITAEISDGMGGCPVLAGFPGFDSELSLFSPTGTLLVNDDNSGVSPCSKIAPAKYSAASNLPVGKYFLQVSSISGQILPFYVLKVKVAPPGCGDGIVQPPEQCDPGPTMVPGCSATCMFTGDYIPETEPNDTQALANPLGTHQGFIGAIKPIGDFDYFSFQVPGPSSLVFIQVSDGIGGCPQGFDSLLTLYGPGGAQLVQDDNGGTGLCSLISPVLYPQAQNLAAGTYVTRVEFKGDNQVCSQYVVTISVQQPGCGDGILEAGEQCDDGPSNGMAGDGCSATCQAVPPWEIEPNNSTATATPQWPGFSTWNGSIKPVGDNDYYSFTLATAGTVTLTTHDVGTPNTCTSDTVIYLDDHNGTQITFDDDSGPGPGDPMSAGKCSKITGQALPAGTYYVWVQRYGNSKIIPSYALDLLVQ